MTAQPRTPRLILIDAYSLLFRAFFGSQDFTTSDNRPTGALYGFTNMLISVLTNEEPEAIVVCWDAHSPSLRKQEFEAYKAHRPDVDDRLIQQMPVARDIVKAMGIQAAELDGYEADDLVGTLAVRGAKDGYHVFIYTGDSDQLQLVGPGITVKMTQRGVTDVKEYDPDAVLQRYGIPPVRLPDYKALTGDKSDNIPGVPGVGDKTATSLLQKFDTIEELIARSQEVTPPRIRGLIEANGEQAQFSKRLATIMCDAPLDLEIKRYAPSEADRKELTALFEDLEFRSMAARLTKLGLQPTTAPASTFEIELTTINSHTELTGLLQMVLQEAVVGVELVVEQNKPARSAAITGVALAMGKGKAWFIPVSPSPRQAALFDLHDDNNGYLADLEALLPLFNTASPKLAAHNVKNVLHGLRASGIFSEPVFAFDTLLAAYLLDSGGRTGYPVNELAENFLRCTVPEKSSQGADVQAAQTASLVCALYPVMSDKLQALEMKEVMDRVDLPLPVVLTAIEQVGILLDMPYMATLSARMAEDIHRLEEQVFECAGTEFNIGSPKQLQEILFDKMQLPSGKKTKTGYSTGADILEQLAPKYEIARHIIDYRELTKLKSTYADALARLADAETHRVHTTLNQTVARTGRLSSTDPNLQNIPIRSEVGREIRRAFIAPTGRVLLSCDYSQVELRVLAHVTGDPTLTQAFLAGEDVHTATASLVFGVDAHNVTRDMRRQAKTINFAVIYGQSAFSLANTLGVENSVAAGWIEDYFRRLPGVHSWIAATKESARALGYVKTLLGRRRYITDINSSNHALRQAAERAAVNMPIQGAAADIMKLAMIDVYAWLKTESAKGCTLLLQVHDELLFEVEEGRQHECGAAVALLMQNAYPMNLPLSTEPKVGHNWADMELI